MKVNTVFSVHSLFLKKKYERTCILLYGLHLISVMCSHAPIPVSSNEKKIAFENCHRMCVQTSIIGVNLKILTY